MGEGPSERRVGGFDTGGRAVVLAMFGGGGLVLGVALPWVTRVADRQEWIPLPGPLGALGQFDGSWLVWGRPVIGLALGLAFAGWVIVNTAVLRVSPDVVRVERRGEVQRVIRRETVDAVHRQGSTVTIEAVGGRTIFSDDIEGPREAVREAFVAAGYPWEGPPD